MSFTKQVKLIICSSDQALVHKNAGKSGFWLFSRDLIIRFFFIFLHKDAYQQCSKHGRVQFLRKIFSLHFIVFPHKNIVNNNAHHQAWFNYVDKTVSKNRRNSRFLPENQYFLNFQGVLYIFMKFCKLMLNENTLNVTAGDRAPFSKNTFFLHIFSQSVLITAHRIMTHACE